MRASSLLLLAFLPWTACGDRRPAAEARIFEVAADEANLVLHVEDHRGVPDAADLEAWLDDRRALETRLEGGAASRPGGRETWHFRLTPGTHRLRAVSRGAGGGGGAELAASFLIGAAPRHWATLSLWTLPDGTQRLAFALSGTTSAE